MEPTFNLIDEPWIPCTDLDGHTQELGLRETLARAHELQGIQGDSPLVTAALYRLLLAVLHSALRGPKSRQEWMDLWNAGTWDMAQMNAYLDRWRNRFYLFHPQRPFYQVVNIVGKRKSIIKLLPEMASGNNATLFDHHTDEIGGVFTPAQAALALIFVQSCSVAGGSGMAPKDSSDAPWSREIIFLIEGDNLFETLTLNLIRYSDDDPLPNQSDDRPAWEMDDPFHPKRQVPRGYLDYLTWQNRKLDLLPIEDGQVVLVREVVMSPGLKKDPSILDPMKHYNIHEKRGLIGWRFKPDRVLWRDSSVLLELNAPEKYRPPRNFHWISNLVREDWLNPEKMYRFMAFGMAGKQARFDFFRQEKMPLPLSYFKREEYVEELSTALEWTEKCCNYLWGAVNTLAKLSISPTAFDENGRQPDQKDVSNLTSHWGVERNYWGTLEVPFLALIEGIPKNPDAAMDEWQRTLERTSWNTFHQAEELAGTSSATLKAGGRAGGQLAGGLQKLFPEKELTL